VKGEYVKRWEKEAGTIGTGEKAGLKEKPI